MSPPAATQISLPALRWLVDISAAPSAAPVVADGYIYLPLKPGIIAAYRSKDGSEAWRVPLAADQDLASAPDMVFVPAAEAIHALDAKTGREVWLAATGTVTAPPLAHGGWVIAVAGRTLFAFRTTDGSQVWKREAGEVRERPAIDGDILYVSFADGRVTAFDLLTGEPRWEQKLGGPATEPLVAGDRVYVGSSDKFFYALLRKNGDLDWKWPIRAPLLGRPAADATHVYFTGMDNLLRAFDLTNGAQRWRRDLPFRPIGGPVVVGEAVTVPGTSAELRLFDPRNGEPLKILTLGAVLAGKPGFGTEPGESLVTVAAITGDLTEQWKLRLFGPLPPPPDPLPTAPLSLLPGRSAPPGT